MQLGIGKKKGPPKRANVFGANSRSEPVGLGHVSDAAIDERSHLCFTQTSCFLKLLLDEGEWVHDSSR